MARSLQRRALVEYLRYPTVFAEPDPPSPRHRLLRSYGLTRPLTSRKIGWSSLSERLKCFRTILAYQARFITFEF